MASVHAPLHHRLQDRGDDPACREGPDEVTLDFSMATSHQDVRSGNERSAPSVGLRSDPAVSDLDVAVALTAHELRRPLIGVRAVLQLLAKDVRDPGRQEVVGRSIRELDRLLATTNALLSWAAGARTPLRRPADVVALVSDVVDSCRLSGHDRIVVFAPERAPARLDPEHVRVAISNLVRNAVDRAEPGTKVQISIETAGEELSVSVTNTGPKVRQEDSARIFDPFVRGEDGSGISGSGLGLYVTRQVAAAHGGDVSVVSEGSATTFRLRLPAGGAEFADASTEPEPW